MIDTFMGKPIKYWIELDSYAKENMYDKLVEKICELEAEVNEWKEIAAIHIRNENNLEAEIKKLEKNHDTIRGDT